MKASDVDSFNAVVKANPQSVGDKIDISVTRNDIQNDSQDALTSTERKRLERCARRKAKQVQKREEKRLQREEDVLRKRMGSKDQKVTLIEKSVLEKVLAKEPASTSLKADRTGSNFFPALGDKVHINRVTVRSNEEVNFSATDSSPSHGGQQTDIAPNVGSNTERTVKRPKRRDLIQIDLSQIIKTQDTHPSDQNIKASEVTKKKQEAVRYSGNILDSDNPERKRGKQREIPKVKKPSRLKATILHDRQLRGEQKTLLLQQKVDTPHTSEIPPLVSELENSETTAESNMNDSQTRLTDLFLRDTQAQDVDHSQSFPCLEESQKITLNNNSDKLSLCCNTVPSPDPSFAVELHLKQEADASELLAVIQEVNELHIAEDHSTDPEHESVSAETGLAEPVASGMEASMTAPNNKLEQHSSRSIHSRKFRDYCDHMLTPELTKVVSQLLEDIVKFHDRQYARNPLKASARRRHCTGLKEVKKYASLRKLKLIVIAPDLEKAPSKGGLDDAVTQIKEQAAANGVPCVFALGRRKLGTLLRKKVPVSCVGILNYDGTETNYKEVLSQLERAQALYQNLTGTGEIQEPIAPDAEADDSSDNASTEVPLEPKPTEECDVNKAVVASLLAKLTEDRPSSQTEVIESREDSDSDDCGE